MQRLDRETTSQLTSLEVEYHPESSGHRTREARRGTPRAGPRCRRLGTFGQFGERIGTDTPNYHHSGSGCDRRYGYRRSVPELDFDQLYEEAAHCRRMMSVSAHDRISGSPQMVRAWDEFLSYAKGRPGVAFLRKEEIARYALESPLTLRESMTGVNRPAEKSGRQDLLG